MRLVVVSLILLSLVACSSEDPNPAVGGGKIGGGGDGVIYHAISVGLDVHKLNLATGEDVKLGDGEAPFRASDGRIVHTTPLDLVESDETFATKRVIVKANDDITQRWNKGFHAPRVSPDGTRVAYTTQLSNMYVVNRADGTVVAKFEVTGSTEAWERPSWTTDGRIVAAGGFANPGLFISDAGLTKMSRFDKDLASPREPAVSPDGSKVAFVLNKRVHVVNIDGSGLVRVDPTDDEDRFPTWSPDGSKLAYRGKAGTIKIVAADGSGQPIDLFDLYPALESKFNVISGTEPFDWK